MKHHCSLTIRLEGIFLWACFQQLGFWIVSNFLISTLRTKIYIINHSDNRRRNGTVRQIHNPLIVKFMRLYHDAYPYLDFQLGLNFNLCLNLELSFILDLYSQIPKSSPSLPRLNLNLILTFTVTNNQIFTIITLT